MSYTVKIVYKNIDDNLRKEIIDMWVSSRVLNVQEASRRVDEVVTVGYDHENKLIGVTTAYSEYVPEVSGQSFFYRMFIKPSFRDRKVRLRTDGFATTTFKYLQENYKTHKGMFFVLENPKISERLMDRLLSATYVGLSPQGLRIFYKEFSL